SSGAHARVAVSRLVQTQLRSGAVAVAITQVRAHTQVACALTLVDVRQIVGEEGASHPTAFEFAFSAPALGPDAAILLALGLVVIDGDARAGASVSIDRA